MRACLIFNPRAGNAEQIKKLLPPLLAEHRCELRETAAAGDAKRIARQAVQEGIERLIVTGGDGTISEVVNGIAPDFSAIELAILPAGTGNDLARVLGLLPDRIDLACRLAFSQQLQPIDLIRISDQQTSYCVNVANGGVGGQAAVDVQSAHKHNWGLLAYWISALSQIGDLQQYQTHLKLDDQSIQTSALGVAISNGRFVGGGFPIAPLAWLNDGLMDITVVPVLPMMELVSTGLHLTRTREQLDEHLRYYRVKKLELTTRPQMPFSVDGEPYQRKQSEHADRRQQNESGKLSASYELLPKSLRVVVGNDPPGLTSEGPK